MHHTFDTCLGPAGYALSRQFKARLQTVDLGSQQFHVESPVNTIQPPSLSPLLLIGADQDTVLFLAVVTRSLRVTNDRRFFLQRCYFRKVLGHQVVMLHVDDRQIQPDPFTDLPGKAAGGIDDVLAGDRALVGHDLPLATLFKARIQHLSVAVDLGTSHAGTGSHRIGRTGRIGVTVIRRVEAQLDVIDHQQRMDRLDLDGVDQVTLNIEIIENALDVTEPVDFIIGQSQSDRPATVPAGGLTGFGFQSLVELGSFVVELGHAQPTDEMGNQARRMPGRTRSQFAFLDQHDIVPAFLGQVVQQPGTQDTATDHDDPCVFFHLCTRQLNIRITVSDPSLCFCIRVEYAKLCH